MDNLKESTYENKENPDLDNYQIESNNNIYTSLSVKQFFKDSVIFITGGTGFLGKVLIEKLLRSCDEIKYIYVLLRNKKGLSSEERYKEFIKNNVFDRIQKKSPDILKKLICVSGDITQQNIGLNEIDRLKIANNVNIVFHAAATVRFNETLKDAANLNTLGTQRVLDLCASMINLKSIVHVSTAYSNPMKKTIGEEVYGATPLDKDSFVKCLNCLPTDILNKISDRLRGSHPNTYTLTKSMAENIVAEYNHKLPICIVRPSIVTSAINEPYSGWIDNVYGITGIMMEIGRGTITSIICDKECTMDVVPVDIVVNTIITAAWANIFIQSEKIRVYNCTSGQINPIKWHQYGTLTEKYARKNPTKYVMLYPGFSYRKNRFIHKIIELLLHFLPAIIFDIILRTQGMKPIMMKIAKKFQNAADTGEFFALHEWNFVNNNLMELNKFIRKDINGNEFNIDMSDMKWDEYIENYMLGIRKYVLKDDLSTMEKARTKIFRLYWMKRIFQIGLFYLLCNMLLKYFFIK